MSSKVLQTVVLLVLLVAFPLVSWIYLRDGLNYRLDALSQLETKAHLPADSLLHQPGEITIWYDQQSIHSDRMEIVKAHFDDRTDVIFMDFPELSKNSLVDSLQKVLTVTGSEATNIQGYAFLIGQEGSIRQKYILASEDALGDLTEHIAFLVPPDPKKEFKFKREEEK